MFTFTSILLVPLSTDCVLLLGELRQPGESHSDVVTRLATTAKSSHTNASPNGNTTPPPPATPEASLKDFVSAGSFRAERKVTKRFLAILSHAIAQQSGAEAALVAANRVFSPKRDHFGSKAAIERSGTKTRPARIIGSNIYALTNLSSDAKCKILGQALQVLAYPTHAIAIAQVALARPDAGQ